MEAGEVFLIEAARFQEDHRESVTENQHGSAAGGRREIQGAGFLEDADIEMNRSALREERFWVAGHRYDTDIKTGESGEDVNEFIGLAAVTQSEDDVSIGNDPQVPVKRVEGVKYDGWRSSAGKGGGDFFTNVPRLSDPDDDDLALAGDRGEDRVNRLAETRIEARMETTKLVHLDVDHASGFFDVVHNGGGRSMARAGGGIQQVVLAGMKCNVWDSGVTERRLGSDGGVDWKILYSA